MLMLDHVLLGGVAGEFVGSSQLAFSISMIAHPFLDKIPHYFPEKRARQAIVVGFDLISCTIALLVFWFGPFPKSVFWGGFGGILIDLLLVNSPLAINSPLGQWHLKRQLHKTEMKYILIDILFISVSAIILLGFTNL